MKPRHFLPTILLALLLAYPLSLGPANLIDRKQGLPAGAARFYAPLVETYLRWPATRQAMHWYIRLWVENPLDG